MSQNSDTGTFDDGFTLTELLLVMGMLAILALLLLPALAPTRVRPRIPCASNLMAIEVAFENFALDRLERYPMQVPAADGGCLEKAATSAGCPASVVFRCLSNELNTPKFLVCPGDKKRTCATNFASLNDKNLSYFVGLDAVRGNAASWLSGDRHLTNQAAPTSPLLFLTTNSNLAWTLEIHGGSGNIAFANRTVMDFTNASLRGAIQALGATTNRLVFP
jgi:prepilin-type N-terminal cleavage/methylation domain-containing protein